MANNRKIWKMVLFMLAVNLLTPAINESNIWGTDDIAYKEVDSSNITGSIVEITSTNDIEATDYSSDSLTVFGTISFVIKSIKVFIYAFAMIPLVGVWMGLHGIPASICVIFEVLNLYLLSVMWGEFAANRRVSQ